MDEPDLMSSAFDAVLYCFRHEMRSAIEWRDSHPDRPAVRTATRLDPVRDRERVRRTVYASTYCYGRVQAMYPDFNVQEVWLWPDYRHEVRQEGEAWRLYDTREGTPIGAPQPTKEDAWAILDKKEMGL